VSKAALARAFFATSLIALGITGMVRGDFTPVWTGVPAGFPARIAVVWFCVLISLGCGLSLLWPRTEVVASRVLLGSLIVWALLFRIPLLFRAPTDSGAWWVCGETAVMLGGVWTLAFAAGERNARIASVLYGLGLIPFGVAHFTFFERTVGMVPGWLPWHVAWAYFTGAAFVAAGIALVAGVLARLAATLSALEMGLFTLLVWGPVLIAGPDASNWDEIVESWALTAAGWLVARMLADVSAPIQPGT